MYNRPNWQRRRRSLLVLVLGLLFLGFLIQPSYQWTKTNVAAMAGRHDSQMSPIIMIPGSSATQNRFDTLVKQLNKADHRRHSLIKLTVMTDDTIKMTG